MYFTKSSITILLCVLFCASFALAQDNKPEGQSDNADARDVTIIIQRRQLRFTAPASAQELRLEVSNQAGEIVYDSGLVSGAELTWALRNTSGDVVPGGLYAYTLMVKDANSETPALRQGQLILESGRDRLWVTNQGAIGAEASFSGGELTVSSGPETNVAGARIGRAATAQSTLNLDFFGTPGRIPMFTGSDFLADSVIWQDFNGRIGIGTQRPGTALLTVAGQIETTSGGIKFPNGTVQTTSAAGALFQVIHNSTLTGNGTEGSPLGVAVPFSLTGSPVGPILSIKNTGGGGGIRSIGANNSGVFANEGVEGIGGDNTGSGFGGTGVVARGGKSVSGTPGSGLVAFGGNSNSGIGGDGIAVVAGEGPSGSGLAGRFSGNIYVSNEAGGIILRAPNSTCHLLSVNNAGLILTPVTCPVAN